MKNQMIMMDFTLKADNDLANYEETTYKRLLNRLNKWPSMPMLQVHKKQSLIAKGNSTMEKLQVHPSSSMGLGNSKCSLNGISIAGSEYKKSNTYDCDDALKYEKPLGSSDEDPDYKVVLISHQINNPGKRKSTLVSLHTLENTIDTCKKFESTESVYEQLSDTSLLSLEESDASSLLNALNSLKFSNESDHEKHREAKPERERVYFESHNDISDPLKNSEHFFYVRKEAKRNSKYFSDPNNQQENYSVSVEKVALEKDSFSKEYLTQFKDRLKEIRRENMNAPTRRPIPNGNRFSRVFNYCFLTR